MTAVPQDVTLDVFFLLAVGAVTLGLSAVAYHVPQPDGPQLVVSLKHAGEVIESTDDEAAPKEEEPLAHMRGAQAQAERVCVPVRLRVLVDGREVVRRSYEPGGLFDDGSSIAIERLTVEPGEHRVQVQIGDTADPDEWTFTDERAVAFGDGRRRVVLFDRGTGFTWR